MGCNKGLGLRAIFFARTLILSCVVAFGCGLLGGCAADRDVAGLGFGSVDVEMPELAPADDGADGEEPGAGAGSEAGAAATPSTAGALQVVGTSLCGAAGEPVQLRGVSTHGLAWFPQYVNATFFQELRNDWNANVVRLALYIAESGGYCTDGDQAALGQLVRDGVRYATDADLYVIVDWHVLADQNPLVNADAAVQFFGDLSAELGDVNNVLYEICNEPNGSATWADVKAYAERVIPVIRANDPDAVVLVGSPEWSQRVDQAAADPLAFDNVMYSLHFYAATHQQDLRDRMATAVGQGLPVFVTEFGICDASGNGAIDYGSADAWVDLMDDLDVSYICWNLSNKDEASALFKATCAKNSGFTEEDLSAEGVWLWEVLHGSGAAGDDPRGALSALSGTPLFMDGEAVRSDPSLPKSTILSGEGKIVWTITRAHSWESGGETFIQYAASVANEGTQAVDGWEVTIPFNAMLRLVDSWNGSFKLEGTSVVISSLEYNGHIDAGSSSSDIGFIVSGPDSLAPDC